MKFRKLTEMTLGILSIFSLISSPILATVSASELNKTIHSEEKTEQSLFELLNEKTNEENEENEDLNNYLSNIIIEANEHGEIIINEQKNPIFSLEFKDEDLKASFISKEDESTVYVLNHEMDEKAIEIKIIDALSEDPLYIYIKSYDKTTGIIDIFLSKEVVDFDSEEEQEEQEEQEDGSNENTDEEDSESSEENENNQESDGEISDSAKEGSEEIDSSEVDSSVNIEEESTESEQETTTPEEEKRKLEEKEEEKLEDELELPAQEKSTLSRSKATLALDPIKSTKNISYYATIKSKNEGIYTAPKGTASSVLVTSYLYNGKEVKVTQEKVTTKGTFAKLVLVSENRAIGWINTKDLDIQREVSSTKKVYYHASVNRKNTGVYTLPKEIYGSKLLTSYLYNDFVFLVTQEATTRNGNYAQLTNIGTNQVIGWIRVDELNKNSGVISKKNVDYYGKVNAKNGGIYTQPKSLKGSVLVTSYVYNNVDVRVVEEMETSGGIFLRLANLKTGKTIGWLNKIDLFVHPGIGKVVAVDYLATVKTGNNGIYTMPLGIFGSVLKTNYLYNKQEFAAVEESVTSVGIYVKMMDKSTGKEIGWINKKDIDMKNYISSVHQVNYEAVVLKNNGGIYTRPKGAFGSILATNYLYNGQTFRVIEEAVTPIGEYLKLTDTTSGKEIGWIAKSGVEIKANNFQKYTTTVLSGNDGIYTLPKVLSGSVLVTSYLYNGQQFEVTEEYVTSKDTFLKLTRLNTGAFVGWINKKWTNGQKTVFIDAGHGGKDTGASYYGVNEKVINLEVSKKVQKILEQKGYNVIMVRTTDVFIDHVTERSEIANASNADVFVSVHHNAMPNNTTAHGIETYYYEYDPNYPSKVNGLMHNDPIRVKESGKLASAIHGSLISGTGAYDRGVRRETFAVLRETSIPAVLLELGYMSSPTEIKKLTTDSYQNTLANSIANGIHAYFN